MDVSTERIADSSDSSGQVLTVVSKNDIGACITRSIAAWIDHKVNPSIYMVVSTHLMQPLTGIVGEQCKHGPHEKIEYGLRDAEPSVHAHLCIVSMNHYIHDILIT